MDNLGFQESVTMGNWKQKSPLNYFLRLRQFAFDPSNTFAGTYHYTQPLTMDPSLKTMNGSFHFTFVDPNGNVVASGDGTVSCTRM